MEHPELEDELLEKVERALGPAQKLSALKSLADLYGNEGYKERQLRYLLLCLEISNGDDKLWRELGEVALSLQRLPFAHFAFKTCVKLKNSSENLYSLALTKALTYDYVNALAILNYLIESQGYEEATELRNYVQSKIRCTENIKSPVEIKWPQPTQEESYKNITKKAANLYSLITQTRVMVDQSKWDVKIKFEPCIYTFDKATTPKLQEKAQKAQEKIPSACAEFAEQVKALIMNKTQQVFMAVVWDKSFQVYIPSTKVSANLEEGIKPLFGTPIMLRNVCQKLFEILLKNSPRPSTMLSYEIGAEILHIYFLCESWTTLGDELLTLLEISNEELVNLAYIIMLRKKVIACLPELENKELRARTYAALALSHFKTREKFEKNRDEYLQELMHVEHLAEKAISELNGASIYLWWTDTILNEKSLNKLRKDVKIDYALLDFEKLAKATHKSAEPILKVLDTWTKLLLAHSSWDDLLFYWRKMKVQLKTLSKYKLSDPERNLLLTILARYVSVLLFNIEEAVSIKKEHDLPILMEILTRQLSPFYNLDQKEICKLCVSILSMMKYAPRLFNYMPFLLKRVFKAIDKSMIPEIFDMFHRNIQHYKEYIDNDFHVKLCNKFEKICYELEINTHLKTIYRWNYALGTHKPCKCGLKYPSNIQSLPNSPEKLWRFLDFTEDEDINKVINFTWPAAYNDRKCYILLKELVEKEPTVFVDCSKHDRFDEMIEKGAAIPELECCNIEKRKIASETFKRLACYDYDSSKKTEIKKKVDSLKEASKFAINAIELCPSNPEYWLILGQISLWKWINGYFDIFVITEKNFAKEDDIFEAIKAYNVASKFESPHQKYIFEARSIAYYFLAQINKNVLEDALKATQEAYDLYKTHSNLIHIIHGLLLLKSKNPECLQVLNSFSPYFEIATYKINKDQESLTILSSQDDPYCKYLYNKHNNSLYSLLIEENFVAKYEMKAEQEILNERQYFMWNLFGKVGTECIKQLRSEYSKEKIINVIDNFLTIKNKTRRNKELSRVFMAALDELISMGYNEDVIRYMEKITILTPQEKKEIKIKLGQD